MTLLQQVPGLPPKRTDYRYDLVSGKVNYVFYQYKQLDQFVHRYFYDADNRITQVQMSADRYVWHTDLPQRQTEFFGRYVGSKTQLFLYGMEISSN